jgi:hypothetical protein
MHRVANLDARATSPMRRGRPIRNLIRWRNVGVAFFASGILSTLAGFALPEDAAGNEVRGALVAYGLTALLFGGGTAVFRHLDARAKDALARGEDVIARWRVEAVSWRAFVAHDQMLDQDSDAPKNELSIRGSVPDDGIDVIVGRSAIQVADSIHALPPRGTPEVTHAAFNTSRSGPSYVELQLYYPGGGQGAAGVPRGPTRTVLRFPVATGFEPAAEAVVAHFGGNRPGQPDSFHGKGDGSDPDDLSTCHACDYQTHKFVSHCPRCGASMQSKRWSRRFGWGLLVCGLFITAGIGAVIFNVAPMLLHPGDSIGGSRFSGTVAQGRFFLGLLALVATFGTTTALYGLWQILAGRRDKRVIYLLLGFGVLLGLLARWI